VLLPAIAGANDYVKRVADRLSVGGFAGAILDYFAHNGAPHAFDEDFRPAVYRPVASKLAWERTMTFLDWHLKEMPAR
jgi:dienelactone hydrolase